MTDGDLSLQNTGRRTFRVRAEDAEDLAIVAAHLQDALLPVSEMSYEPKEHRFVMVVQRYMWETAPDRAATSDAQEGPVGQRVHCGVHFDGVTAVRTLNLPPKSARRILNLLTMHPSEGQIDLAFADNVTIRLAVDRIMCHIEDLGEPWPTVFTPSHPDAEGEEAKTDGSTDA